MLLYSLLNITGKLAKFGDIINGTIRLKLAYVTGMIVGVVAGEVLHGKVLDGSH